MKNNYILIVIRDLNSNPASDYTTKLTAQGYHIEYVLPGVDPVPLMQRRPPIAACFQFDYPDTAGLSDLRRAKQQAPAVPLLMITQAHSEQLAVWAFRTRVWDYFVYPLDTSRLLSVLEVLASLKQHGQMDVDSRAKLDMTNTIPPEARQHRANQNEDKATLDRALAYLDKNLHKKIVQSEVAELCGLSPFQFSRLFRRVMKVTFQDYLLSRRIEEAKRLLANPRISVTDVCFTVGFRDLSYFTRVFQRYVGLPPSRYRQSLEPATTLLTKSQREVPRQDATRPGSKTEQVTPGTGKKLREYTQE
ncbi:helix-turn-helix transcriptional regulator [Modicisalibacter xianhensis]|uniref:AraC-type DNA-binding protein n=1 Tax=Modicisalibacter xianhensis TaxID=442341 RepID=A0A1I2ZMI4_9GAMM|nr:DNA-binding response regulator [Halomonas xianhensis]SFH39043.1 AraC-type DNA-binding protein [Halomonas xianhensis]